MAKSGLKANQKAFYSKFIIFIFHVFLKVQDFNSLDTLNLLFKKKIQIWIFNLIFIACFESS
jgi:hypothetical protein